MKKAFKMSRYNKIHEVTFDSNSLQLITNIKISKQAEVFPSKPDSHLYVSNIDIDEPFVKVEIHSRDIDSFNLLTIGQEASLKIKISTVAGAKKLFTYPKAMLINLENIFSQKDFASSKLTFICRSENGTSKPETIGTA